MAHESSEKEFLKYSGNKVPRLIRFVWTVLVVFSAYYLFINFVPDLKEWLNK